MGHLTDQTDDIMISSDKILTMVDPKQSLLDAYLTAYSMKFYTSVFQLGNDILVRGYENGKHFTKREPFQPRFLFPLNEKVNSRPLMVKMLGPIHPGTIRECKEFLEKYDGVNGFKESMGMIDSYTNTFNTRTILRKRSSSIFLKSKLSPLTLRLRRRVDSPMYSTAAKNFY